MSDTRVWFSRETRKRVHAACFAALTIVLVAGCEPFWEDDPEPLGAATIRGNIASFQVAGVVIRFDAESRPGLLQSALELLVPSAYAADGLGGIAVFIRSLGLSTTTDDAGNFIISGVPAGKHELVFKYGEREVAYPVSVEEKATVALVNVKVIEGSGGLRVSVPEIRVTTYANSTPTTRVIRPDSGEASNSTGTTGAGDSSGSGGTQPVVDPGGWLEEEN